MANRFRELCDELNRTWTPALRAAGFEGPGEEFSRDTLRQEFKRSSPSGTQTIAVLFNRRRAPQFSVQLYLEPPAGLRTLEAGGGTLIVGTLSPGRSTWPFGVRAFGQGTVRSRLFGSSPPSAAQAVRSAVALIPEIEAWWLDQRSCRHIVAGRVTYPGGR